MKKLIDRVSNFINIIRFFILFKKKGHLYKNCSIDIYGSLSVGTGCIIKGNTSICVRKHGSIAVGDNVYIGRFSQIECAERIDVYDNVTISDNCFISDVTHTIPVVIDGVRHENNAGVVSIGCGAWLGRNVSLIPGVSIAEGVVVGSNSVVTNSILAPNTIWAGSPARYIRDC